MHSGQLGATLKTLRSVCVCVWKCSSAKNAEQRGFWALRINIWRTPLSPIFTVPFDCLFICCCCHFHIFSEELLCFSWIAFRFHSSTFPQLLYSVRNYNVTSAFCSQFAARRRRPVKEELSEGIRKRKWVCVCVCVDGAIPLHWEEQCANGRLQTVHSTLR